MVIVLVRLVLEDLSPCNTGFIRCLQNIPVQFVYLESFVVVSHFCFYDMCSELGGYICYGNLQVAYLSLL